MALLPYSHVRPLGTSSGAMYYDQRFVGGLPLLFDASLRVLCDTNPEPVTVINPGMPNAIVCLISGFSCWILLESVRRPRASRH